jgi:outer membrane receptor protein involved in Fe transport
LPASCTPLSRDVDPRVEGTWRAYELGAKLQLLDNRLHLDASVFKIDWNNIQQRVLLPVCGSGFIDNLGSATSTGFDLSGEFKASPHFLFGASVGYTDAKFTKTFAFSNGTIIVRDGDPVAVAGESGPIRVLRGQANGRGGGS